MLITSGRHLTTLSNLGGGAALAYIFLYLLFELISEGAPEIHVLLPLGPAPIETLIILLLIATAATYVVQLKVEGTPEPRDDHRALALLFLFYNFLAGFGLSEEAQWGILNLALFVFAIGVHLLFNDLFLLERYPTEHTTVWQVALGFAPVLGCGLESSAEFPVAVIYTSLALVAGGSITIALRRELPEVQMFRPTAFIAGMVLYAVLIFALWRF
jgi:hypothetical protein